MYRQICGYTIYVIDSTIIYTCRLTFSVSPCENTRSTTEGQSRVSLSSNQQRKKAKALFRTRRKEQPPSQPRNTGLVTTDANRVLLPDGVDAFSYATSEEKVSLESSLVNCESSTSRASTLHQKKLKQTTSSVGYLRKRKATSNARATASSTILPTRSNSDSEEEERDLTLRMDEELDRESRFQGLSRLAYSRSTVSGDSAEAIAVESVSRAKRRQRSSAATHRAKAQTSGTTCNSKDRKSVTFLNVEGECSSALSTNQVTESSAMTLTKVGETEASECMPFVKSGTTDATSAESLPASGKLKSILKDVSVVVERNVASSSMEDLWFVPSESRILRRNASSGKKSIPLGVGATSELQLSCHQHPSRNPSRKGKGSTSKSLSVLVDERSTISYGAHSDASTVGVTHGTSAHLNCTLSEEECNGKSIAQRRKRRYSRVTVSTVRKRRKYDARMNADVSPAIPLEGVSPPSSDDDVHGVSKKELDVTFGADGRKYRRLHVLSRQTHTPGVRRSKRTRIPPVRHWDGEEVEYDNTQKSGIYSVVYMFSGCSKSRVSFMSV